MVENAPADYRNKKLLFRLRRRDLLQARPSTSLPSHYRGVPLLALLALEQVAVRTTLCNLHLIRILSADIFRGPAPSPPTYC